MYFAVDLVGKRFADLQDFVVECSRFVVLIHRVDCGNKYRRVGQFVGFYEPQRVGQVRIRFQSVFVSNARVTAEWWWVSLTTMSAPDATACRTMPS